MCKKASPQTIVEAGKKSRKRNIGKSEELVEMDEAEKMRKWIKSKRKKNDKSEKFVKMD